MRIISFSQKWPKLEQLEFTTFRFHRKDKDWRIGERFQIYYKSGSKNRESLGNVELIDIEQRSFLLGLTDYKPINKEEAKEDGFESLKDMLLWLSKTYSSSERFLEPICKLTLRRII